MFVWAAPLVTYNHGMDNFETSTLYFKHNNGNKDNQNSLSYIIYMRNAFHHLLNNKKNTVIDNKLLDLRLVNKTSDWF